MKKKKPQIEMEELTIEKIETRETFKVCRQDYQNAAEAMYEGGLAKNQEILKLGFQKKYMPKEKNLILLKFRVQSTCWGGGIRDALNVAKELDLVRPTFEDALLFAGQHPEKQIKYPIIFPHNPKLVRKMEVRGELALVGKVATLGWRPITFIECFLKTGDFFGDGMGVIRQIKMQSTLTGWSEICRYAFADPESFVY
jgi:hypothetical protein